MARGRLNSLVSTLRRTTETSALDELPDAELLARYQASRDEAAFAVLVRRHGPLVIAAARQLLSDPADVDDAFQAAWLMFVRESKSIRDGAALSGWMYRVAYRIAIRLKQRHDKRRELGEAGADEPDLSWREACAVLHEELDRLPDKFRLPLVLCYLDGRSRDEAAKQLGWTEGTVKGRLERGRDALRERLTRRGVTLSAGLLGAIAASRAEAIAPNLVNSVTRFVTNPAVAPAGLSALCAGVAPTMSNPRRWPLLAALLLAGILGTGTYLLARPKPEEPPAKPQAEKPAAETLTLSGRVSDSNGKPIEGARLHWAKLSDIDLRAPDEEKLKAPERARTDKEGRFHFEIPRSDAPEGIKLPLMVLADGYGLGWVQEPAFGSNVEVVLAPEQRIKGRAIDTQGQPLAGVDVQIVGLIVPNNGKLDEFLAAWEREWDAAAHQAGRVLYFPLNKLIGKTTTDADGRFELKSVARDQVAMVQIGGAGSSQQTLYVVNRPGFDPARINQIVGAKMARDLPSPSQHVRLAGPTFDHVASPTKIIEGLVTDFTTGKPLKDVRVSAATGYGQGTSAKTDTAGRFKLAGLPKQKEFLVIFSPPREESGTLLSRTVRLQDTEGLGPIQANVELNHGVVLTGQVIDKSTSKGVRAAVRFAPLPENKFHGSKPGYDSYDNERLMSPTDARGRFRMIVIPGPGVLMCQADAADLLDGMPLKPWLPAEFDDEDRGKVPVVGDARDRYYRTAGNKTEFLGLENAVKVVTSKEGSGPVSVNLYLRRGLTRALKLVDPDGKPVAGATVSGLTASYPITFTIKSDSCTVFALDEKKPRMVAVLHPQRGLGGVTWLSGEEKGTLELKLAPTASLKGRLLDLEGQSIAGAAVVATYADDVGRDLTRFVKPAPPAVKTDAEGRFELGGVVPGLPMYLDANKDRKSLIGEPRIGVLTLKPGEARDLGERKLRPAQ
jgi:RNA polymerase sigma factor (sigma-70 family)